MHKLSAQQEHEFKFNKITNYNGTHGRTTSQCSCGWISVFEIPEGLHQIVTNSIPGTFVNTYGNVDEARAGWMEKHRSLFLV